MRNELRLRAKNMPSIPEEISGSKHIEQYIKRLAVRIHKGYFQSKEKPDTSPNENEDIPIPSRNRRRKSFQLSKAEMLDIVHAVLVESKPVNMVAKQFRVTPNTVNLLTSKARKNQKFIAEIFL